MSVIHTPEMLGSVEERIGSHIYHLDLDAAIRDGVADAVRAVIAEDRKQKGPTTP